MNEAANLIAESILGKYFATFRIGGKVYTVYPPSIKLICRAISHFSKIEMREDHTTFSVVSEIPQNVPHLLKGLSVLIAGDVWNWRWKSRKVCKQLESGTNKELKEALQAAINTIGGADFFVSASWGMSVATMGAKQK